MKQYIYVQCEAKRDDPLYVSFRHAFVTADDEREAYDKGQALKLPVLEGFQFANDYVAVV